MSHRETGKTEENKRGGGVDEEGFVHYSSLMCWC